MEELRKPVKLYDRIIYPDNLYNLIIKKFKDKTFSPSFFAEDCIRVIVIADTDEERLDDTSKQIQEIFKTYIERIKLIILDDEEINIQLNSIKKQIENGIKEESFYDWFMTLAFQTRQLTVPLDEFGKPKERYNPASSVYCYRFDGGLICNYIFFSNNSSLLNEITLDQLCQKASEDIKKTLSGNKKKFTKRSPIDSRLRHECFKRDNYTCKECGATKSSKILHCDHIIPVAQGGVDELDNLQTLCCDCNLAKSNKCFKAGVIKEV